MVYAGRPSKACERCRTRRIKCDFGQPHCRKCVKAFVLCPGYRNQQDLLFRNQTNDVINKHSLEPTSLVKFDSPSPPTNIKYLGLVQEPGVTDGKFILDEGTLEVAVTFLLRCYFRGSSFEWVSKLYGTSSCSTVFTDVVRATALAAYSHESHRLRLLMQARAMYNDALLQVRKSIEHGESTTDSIWGSVLLMSRFETLLNDGNEWSITDNWLNHVSGAFAIMQSRKRQESLEGSISQALMEQTVHNYNLYCLRTRTQPPATLIRAIKELYQNVHGCDRCVLKELRLAFHDVSIAFGQFRRIEQESDQLSPLEVIRWAQEVEEKTLHFQHRLSAASSFKVLPVSDLQRVDDHLDYHLYFDKYHVYGNHHEARMWNGVRMMRLTVHDCIQSYSRRLRSSDTTWEPTLSDELRNELERLAASSIQIIAELVTDICASAPQFLRPGSPDCTHAAACFLAWPLFVAGKLARCKTRAFVRAALCWIACEMNIKSARIAADYLPEQEYKDGCLHACYMF